MLRVCRRARCCKDQAYRWPQRSGPVLTASARAGLAFPRSGREKACGAVEQEK